MTEVEFIEQIKKLGLSPTKEQLKKLNQLYEMMIEENKVMNLTRIVEKDDVYLKHFYDSLTIVKVCDFSKIETLCDVGTGAGFPGLVLKIFFSDVKITLVDALQKRVNYLNKVINVLGLEKIEAIHIRAEDLAKKGNRYDIVTARAVANLSKLLSWTMPLVKKDGSFIAMKGNVSEELTTAMPIIQKKNYILEKKVEFNLPKENSVRTILRIKYKN
ncbi:MAG: 16S rRNA (guanine(527)-N(7))-methyltransferase RsmG [bacterium]|nr:16S rRNA (guanine(527)-N(7))-methyltransferase RsmG [bacterium]